MSGHIKKIPTCIKELCVIAICSFAGVFVAMQDHADVVFSSMDGVLTYLSIMASVSFAILAILMQRFDNKRDAAMSVGDLEDEALNIIQNMNVEILRIVFMLLPVLAYSAIAFFDVRNNVNAGFLAAITFMAILFSICLPSRYVFFMKRQIVESLDESQKKEAERKCQEADELMKKVNGK